MIVNNPKLEAYLDDFSSITIVVYDKNIKEPVFYLNGSDNDQTLPLKIETIEHYDTWMVYKCSLEKEVNIAKEYWISVLPHKVPIKLGSVVRSPKFDELFYDEGPLGAIYSPEYTTFSVWSPVAIEMKLLYKPTGFSEMIEVEMERTDKGTWKTRVTGDHHLTEYLYVARVNHVWIKTTDPYSKAVTVNGERSVVVQMERTDPENWKRSIKKINLRSKLESVIYEVHVRDMTIHSDSGVKNKGKFLGLTEKNTKTRNGYLTGIEYLSSLGVTHIQLMPVADFGSVDEEHPDKRYNWGYDPVHFFVPEGSYATNPYDPVCRIRELKMLIQSLKEHGLSVILDVVFNHVYERENSAFEKLVPGYFFRYDHGGNPVNGTGVGNDTASERKMMRKFIVDALIFWMTEYKVDGFRFDLMGIHDIETMIKAADKLKKINPGVLLLGEGWDLNTNLDERKRATLNNAKQLPDYSFFNDAFRDCIKGSIFPGGQNGIIGGNMRLKNQVIASIKGHTGKNNMFLHPEQSINYTECHDNHTLFDLLYLRHPHEKDKVRRKRQLLALAFTLFSRGVPFIHAGQEFFRSKKGVENSYNSPDSINAFNWSECERWAKEVQYFRDLLWIKTHHPVFNHENVIVQEKKDLSNCLLAIEYHIPFTDKKSVENLYTRAFCLYNLSYESVTIQLENNWNVIAEEIKCMIKEVRKVNHSYTLKPLSFSLLMK